MGLRNVLGSFGIAAATVVNAGSLNPQEPLQRTETERGFTSIASRVQVQDGDLEIGRSLVSDLARSCQKNGIPLKKIENNPFHLAVIGAADRQNSIFTINHLLHNAGNTGELVLEKQTPGSVPRFNRNPAASPTALLAEIAAENQQRN